MRYGLIHWLFTRQFAVNGDGLLVARSEADGKIQNYLYHQGGEVATVGSASKAEIRTSSGYERLDQTALQTVLKWRYVPGKRAGVPEAMWFNIPINFVLE